MLAALIPALAPKLLDVLARFIPDPEARQKAVENLMGVFVAIDTAQIDVNKSEASSNSLFVAGWRPFIGWACGFAFVYTYLLVPIAMFIGFVIGKPLPKPPVLDNNLWELMFGMLGMGALRSFEKLKGIK